MFSEVNPGIFELGIRRTTDYGEVVRCENIGAHETIRFPFVGAAIIHLLPYFVEL